MNVITGQLRTLDRRQICRYMGMGNAEPTEQLHGLIDAQLPKFLSLIQCMACYRLVPVSISGDRVDLGPLRVTSGSLARNLRGCDWAVLFAATLGMSIDRQKRAASARSPVSALILDAMGSAAIEAWCDMVCEEIAARHPERKARPRFSPGYGDLPLDVQKQLLEILDAQRKLGLTLTAGMLMIPQKSVTAVMGLGREGCSLHVADCSGCNSLECIFRL